MIDEGRVFTLFSGLPVEIRLKIWAQACAISRTIDVWTDFKRCEVDNTIFYCQQYLVELAHLPPPFLLSTCHEAREEALKYYSLEFPTSMHCAPGIDASIPARWYVNWRHDILVPRGYWNIVSFADFVSRGIENGLRRVAIDVSGVFWRENLKHYVLGADCWALNGVQEVVLYDSRDDEMWKGSEYLDKFRRRYMDGPRDLSFEPLEGPVQEILHVQRLLIRCWDICQGVESDHHDVEEANARRYLDDFITTTKEEILRPELNLMRLIARKPGVDTVVRRNPALCTGEPC